MALTANKKATTKHKMIVALFMIHFMSQRVAQRNAFKSGGERHGRVMKVNSHFTCIVQEVPKGVLNFNFVALRGGEEVVAHGHTDFAFGDDIDIFKTNCRPAFDRKPFILWTSVIGCNKI